MKIIKDYDHFSKLASGIQSIVTTLGLILCGIWALIRYDALSERDIATAQRKKYFADAKEAERIASVKKVIYMDLNVKELKSKVYHGRWVLVELSVKNTGNENLKIDLNKSKFYVTKVDTIDRSGIIKYNRRFDLKLDYIDKTLKWLLIRPGTEVDRYRTIQKLNDLGLYLVRFTFEDPDTSIGKSREFSAETFFIIK